MAADANIYKTVYCLDAYSTGGSFTDPIFDYPTYYFRGDTGESKDLQCWLKNDGDTILKSLGPIDFELQPLDVDGTDESTWIRLATTQGGLDGAGAGVALAVPILNPGETFPFWIRVTVPIDTNEENKQDLRVKIQAVSVAV